MDEDFSAPKAVRRFYHRHKMLEQVGWYARLNGRWISLPLESRRPRKSFELLFSDRADMIEFEKRVYGAPFGWTPRRRKLEKVR